MRLPMQADKPVGKWPNTVASGQSGAVHLGKTLNPRPLPITIDL